MCMETQQHGLMFGSSCMQKMAAPLLLLVEIPENTRHLQQVSTLSVRRQVTSSSRGLVRVRRRHYPKAKKGRG
jgi:hypothetical protein